MTENRKSLQATEVTDTSKCWPSPVVTLETTLGFIFILSIPLQNTFFCFVFVYFFKTKKHCCLQESFPEYWQLNLKFCCPLLEKVFNLYCLEKKTITPPTIRHQAPRPYFDIFDFQYVQVFQMPRKEWVAKKDIECSLVTFLFELIVIFMGCDFQFLKILA